MSRERELVRIAQQSLHDGAAQTINLLDIIPLLWTEAHNLSGQEPTVIEEVGQSLLTGVRQHALEDLEARGLLDSTLVVAVGEFGRTPRVNGSAGRDHWPDCYTAVLAGGGTRGGAVFGASDRTGAFPASDPVAPADLAATIFSRFGIDPDTEVKDQLSRPYRLSDGKPITAIFS